MITNLPVPDAKLNASHTWETLPFKTQIRELIVLSTWDVNQKFASMLFEALKIIQAVLFSATCFTSNPILFEYAT